MKQGTYPRTERTKKLLREALLRRKQSGEIFGFQSQGAFHNKLSCIDCGKMVSGHSKRCIPCRGISIRGDNHPRWQGGKSTIAQRIRQSKPYKAWRTAVFKRDNFTCTICFKRCGNGKNVTLNADHIKPFSLYPELRLEVSNGRTLCETCHRDTDNYGWKGAFA